MHIRELKKKYNLHHLETTPNIINNRFNYMTSHLREGNVGSVDTLEHSQETAS